MEIKEIYLNYRHALLHPDLLLDLLASNFIAHDHPSLAGPDALIAFRREIMSAFPDQSVEIVDILVEDVRVASRFISRQTHTGEFVGVAPTGKQFDFEGYEIVHLERGKIAARWTALKPSSTEILQLLRTAHP